jgi:hypothetical protein
MLTAEKNRLGFAARPLHAGMRRSRSYRHKSRLPLETLAPPASRLVKGRRSPLLHVMS